MMTATPNVSVEDAPESTTTPATEAATPKADIGEHEAPAKSATPAEAASATVAESTDAESPTA